MNTNSENILTEIEKNKKYDRMTNNSLVFIIVPNEQRGV